MSGDVRSMFVGVENAEKLSAHEQEMRRQREQRGKMVGGVIAVACMLLILLAIVAAICGATLMVRATF